MAREIYSFDEDKMVTVEDNPSDVVPAKETPKAEEKVEAEEQEEEVEPDNKEEESEQEESTNDDEPEDKVENEEEKEDEEEVEEQPVDIDNIIADTLGDKYGIKNEEEFIEVIDRAAELLDENVALSKKIKELEAAPKEPVFKSESQKVVYEALKDYDPARLQDGIQMIAGLINIDLEKTDPKLILEQEFIMQHPELSIDESRRKFNRRFESKYIVKEEDFESVEEYKDKKEDLESDLKIDASKAKKFIKEKQQEFKNISEEKPKTENEVPKEVISGIASNTKSFEEHIDGLDNLTFELDDDPKNPFTYKFNKDQLSKIKVVAEGYLKNPRSYDEKGNLVGGFDPEQKFQQAALALFGAEMVEEALKSARSRAQILKAEEIGKKKPDRKPKSSGDIQDESIDAQTDRLMAKKKAEREAARGR